MNNISKNIKELYEILSEDLDFIESFNLGKRNQKTSLKYLLEK